MKNRITILDIARKSGVSKSSVAYALSDNYEGKVSPENRKKVLAAAKSLGYSPNIMAKYLRTNKSSCIGVMLPYPTSYFYGALSLELQRIIWSKGYTVFFAFWSSFEDAATIRNNYKKLLTWNVEGIITCELPGAFPEKAKIPFVFYQPFNDLNHDIVSVDYSGIINAIKILKNKGHRKFSMLSPNCNSQRKEAFFNALKKLKLKNNPDWMITGKNPRELGKSAMKKLLAMKNRPTVIVGHNDETAISAMNEAKMQGVDVPREMAFIGIDNVEEAAFSNPPLATFNIKMTDIAEALVDLLFKRLNTPGRKIAKKSIKPEFIQRESI